MTASIPVIEFARELQVSHDKLLRALVLSNLVTIHLKTESELFLHIAGP